MDKLRFSLIIILSKLYNITLAFTADNSINDESIEALKPYIRRFLVVYKTKGETGRIKRLINYSLSVISITFSGIPAYAYLNYNREFRDKLVLNATQNEYFFIQCLSDFSAIYMKYLPSCKLKITGPMDDTMELFRQRANWAKGMSEKLKSIYYYFITKRYFRSICKESDLILFHSQEDLNRVKNRLGFPFNGNVLYVPTDIVEKAEEPDEAQEPDSMIFVGGFGAFFNQDAALFFVNRILPIIRTQKPEIKLFLVGNHPPEKIRALQKRNEIIVTGEVDDVGPFIKRASVYISPVRIGTGIKTKIVEALSFSKAMVISSASCNGLWAFDKEIYISDEPEDFAAKVLAIFNDQALRRQKEIIAKKLFNDFYAFSIAEKKTLEFYSTLEEKVISGL
jgi:polysaccharide biosynthesis protein PslH